MNRRKLLNSSLIASGLAAAPRVFAQEPPQAETPDDPTYKPETWNFRGLDVAPFYSDGGKGGGPSRNVDVRNAFRILFNAPRDKTPYEVAKYFASQTGAAAKYMEEFKKTSYANPLVVGFFSATHTIPAGDKTPWCAAFVNFCFMACGLQGTGSALSGTFRRPNKPANEFKEVTTPEPGDIAVFHHEDPERARKGFGHVAFFQSRSGNKVTVLGGNQSDAINVKTFTVSVSDPKRSYSKIQYMRVK